MGRDVKGRQRSVEGGDGGEPTGRREGEAERRQRGEMLKGG